ncbi:hypothetical protein RND71_029318 [Anisodus tanguticus]|uniref:MADS-box domain-containing protein n=1 Tax=Anisodus tanguticus TaxID=243964 RepID=A0AAE1V740_9SOLA|nr:hypothetical protein RND71_029318 [Anisodus tanguticus]
MKLIESKYARTISFSKRKKSLFKKADELSTLTGADVGVLLISPSDKPYSYGSTSIENITDKFLELKLADRQRDHSNMGKSNVFEVFEDLYKQLQAPEEKEKDRVLRYNIMHRGSEKPHDKHMLVSIKLQMDEIKKETKGCVLAELLKSDLNVAPEPNEESS